MPNKKLIAKFFMPGIVVALLSNSSAIAVSDSDGPPPLSSYVSDEQAHLDQVHELGTTLNLRDTDVELRLANEAKYSDLVDLALTAYSSVFAGSGVVDPVVSQVWLRFVGTVPDQIADMAKRSGISVDLQSGARLSLEKVMIQQSRLVALLGRAGTKSFFVDIRQKPDLDLALIVYVNGDSAIQQAVSRAIYQFGAAKSSLVGLEVIQERSDFTAQTTAITGGGNLTGPGGSCTAAFTVTKGNLAGVATANHCSTIGSTLYYQNNLSYFYAGNLATQGDAAWYLFPNTTNVTNKIIYNSAGSVMSITSSGNPVAGTSVCRFGKTTGYKCGTIGSASVCLTFGGGYSCNYATITPGSNDFGDSGGPVFAASKAVGTTTGNFTSGGTQTDVITKISSLGLLGVSVKITP